MTGRSTTPVDVEIFGAVYHVRGEHDPEHLKRLAEIVDRKMHEIGTQVATTETDKIAILAALNLADELHQCTTRQEGERVQIMEKVTDLTGKLTEVLQQT